MNVALYARVSTSDQDCALQLLELRQVARNRGWAIVSEYVDQGWSGRTNDRPALNRLMDALPYGGIDLVLVWKIDRFGRSVADLVRNIQILEAAGVRFCAVSQGIDTDQSNPTARLQLHILAAVAEFEAELIRERVKAGVEHAKKVGTRSGNPIGRPVKVFRRDEALRLRAGGKSIREIARQLHVGKGTVERACPTIPTLEEQPSVDNRPVTSRA